MEKNNIINREQLFQKIHAAERRIRILGAVAFDLPYDEFKEEWLKKINAGELTVEIICESESSLSYDALIASDRKVSGENRSYEIGDFRNIAKEALMNLKHFLEREKCKHLEPNSEGGQNLFIRTYYLAPKIPVINVDGDYYIGLALTKFNHIERFEKITKDHIWATELYRYFNAFLDSVNGARKYSTEETKSGNKLEVIQMFNNDRVPQGQLPRDSFLDSTRIKVVVWGLIFTKDGYMLIHQRSKNAKDNQGLWDKSIGGHVDIERDIDTVKAASRELLEELYKKEDDEQGGYNKADFFKANEDKLVFLGEWRPSYRLDSLFEDTKYKPDESYFWRMNYKFSRKVVNSPRILPDGSKQTVKAFVDLYICIASDDFASKVADNKLKNSKYKLLKPYQLKDWYRGVAYFDEKENREAEYREKDDNTREMVNAEFKVTPDLETIINSDIFEDDISSFAAYLETKNKSK
ncbi:MAG: NUDIX domain-containing protein [Chitinispirillales bacterium]|jgi:isopentenyldiphosphate isomerase|nr:NUDIX domain-containing protein [Chitinispirillales bacterium]